MSEKEKMLDGHLYQPYSSELYKDREFCQGMLYEYNRLSPLHRDERDLILKKLLKCKGELCIEQPFHCSYGYNIEIGLNFYSDINLTSLEYAKPVTIYDNVWIGGNVTILLGVKINQGAIIGAGSVVTHDIPPYVIAAGNPCEVIRSITQEDVHKKW